MSRLLILILISIFFSTKFFGQANGGWGTCEFTTVAAMNSYDPSTSSNHCKKVFVQATNDHYHWDGTVWVLDSKDPENIYNTSDSLSENRIVTLDGYDLTFKGTTDFFIESTGNVGIGTVSPDAQLDVENGTVRFSDYGSGTITGTGTYVLGVDTDGDIVEMNTAKSSKIFYPPAMTIDASATVTSQTIDLHQQYMTLYGSPAISSATAPTFIPTYLEGELYYYLVDFDTAVLDNVSIDANGVMTYDIITVPSDKCAIITMVFVVK